MEELKRLEHAQDERRRYHGECLAFIEAVTDLEMELPSLEEIYMKTQRNEALYKAMLKLPVKQMRRIYAHFFLRLSETEIARAERVSIAAVSASFFVLPQANMPTPSTSTIFGAVPLCFTNLSNSFASRSGVFSPSNLTSIAQTPQ